MKKNSAIILLCAVIIAASDMLMALDTGRLIAYPVPYNPKRGARVLTFGFGDAVGEISNLHVKVEIFDINGDLVFKRSYGSLPAVWNGYNARGNLVKPGLYIVKIDVEDTMTHSQGKKIIRVLVNY
jgi:hypothetical protein